MVAGATARRCAPPPPLHADSALLNLLHRGVGGGRAVIDLALETHGCPRGGAGRGGRGGHGRTLNAPQLKMRFVI